jgi:hypothetical protein
MLVQPLPPVLSAPEPHSQFQKFHMVLLPVQRPESPLTDQY